MISEKKYLTIKEWLDGNNINSLYMFNDILFLLSVENIRVRLVDSYLPFGTVLEKVDNFIIENDKIKVNGLEFDMNDIKVMSEDKIKLKEN
jgi:hypothetical protein